MSLFLKLISIVKGRDIVLDRKVNFFYLLQLSTIKFLALLRGLIFTWKLVFLGRGASVIAAKQLFVSNGVEIGPYCQIDCLSHKGLFIGSSSKIGAFSTLKVSGSLADLGVAIRIGDNVGIGEYAHIGGAAEVTIGDNTITGSYLSIHPENHIFSDISLSIRLQGVTRQGVHIGSNCWIGAKASFLDGSEIGDGCVVAAGAVVTKKFGRHLLIGGVPARVLKDLKNTNAEKPMVS